MTDPVEIPDTWHDNESARAMWKSGCPSDEEQLATLLAVAKQQVIEYGPLTLGEDDPVPPHYRLAQLIQAQNIWSSRTVDAGAGQLGDGTFQIRPFPLDWMVRQIIRPKRAVPAVY